MMRNKRPLNPEHTQSHLPMGGLIRQRVKRLFLMLAALTCTHILILWAFEPLNLFESAWLTITTLVTVG